MSCNADVYKFESVPELTDEQKTSPFARFYFDPVPKPAPEILSAIGEKQMPVNEAVDFSEIERFFLPGSESVKSGWCILPDGTAYTHVMTKMPDVTPETEKWWNSWFMDPAYDYLNYRIWMPGLHYSHAMPIVEDMGWGPSRIRMIQPLFPKLMPLSADPEALDPAFFGMIGSSGIATPVDGPQDEMYTVLVSCIKRSGNGLLLHTVGYIGMKWENGVLVKMHDADPEKTRLFVTHNAYEFSRKAELAPRVYKYACTLPNKGINPNVTLPDMKMGTPPTADIKTAGGKDILKKEKKQIVIMGAGLSGLAAAVSAGERGSEVLVLEMRKVVGGISVTGMGLFAVESHHQKHLNLDSVFTKDDAFHFIMDRTQWKVDPRIARAYVDKSADTIEWLENIGVKFELINKVTFPGEMQQTGHLVVSPKVGTGPTATGDLIDKLYVRAQELGVEVRTNSKVKDLEKTPGGFLLTYEDSEGEDIGIEAEAVIITSGGYGYDAEMMKNTGHGYVLNQNVSMATDIPLTGVGIRLARKLGAVPDGMDLMLTSFCDGESFPRSRATMAMMALQVFSFPYLWVNRQGERFVDEGAMNGCYLANAISRQKDGTYYVIMDNGIKEKIKNEGPDIYGYLLDGDKADLDELFDAVTKAGAGQYYRADTLEELAAMMDIPYENLKKTIDEYNAACHQGYDPLFDKKRKFLRPIENPGFYAIRRKNASYGTVGGIRIDHRAQVINGDHEAIHGLYAAGDCANSMVAYDLGLMYSLWGSCLGFAANFGRIAGESAADQVLKK